MVLHNSFKPTGELINFPNGATAVLTNNEICLGDKL